MVASWMIRNVLIELYEGDITDLMVDVIVNPANNELWMEEGVAGAIKRIGGEVVEWDAMRHGPVPIGTAIPTNPGRLNRQGVQYVIHAVVMGQDLETNIHMVEEATWNALRAANDLDMKSIAIPMLGTGVGGLPYDIVAHTMLATIGEFIESFKAGPNIEHIVLVAYDDEAYRALEDFFT